jgi:hypothetical protein
MHACSIRSVNSLTRLQKRRWRFYEHRLTFDSCNENLTMVRIARPSLCAFKSKRKVQWLVWGSFHLFELLLSWRWWHISLTEVLLLCFHLSGIRCSCDRNLESMSTSCSYKGLMYTDTNSRMSKHSHPKQESAWKPLRNASRIKVVFAHPFFLPL